MAAPVASPPAATSGQSTMGAMSCSAAQQGEVRCVVVIDEDASVASGFEALHDHGVGLERCRDPRFVGRCDGEPDLGSDGSEPAHDLEGGTPNVNDTTATGSSHSRSIFASKESSSKRGAPGATPSWAASSPISSM